MTTAGATPYVVSAEEARALPMPLHHLTRDEHGRATPTCDAPAGSACRLACAEECGAEQWPCGGWDYERDEEREAHPMRDSGECHVVLFLSGEPDECADEQSYRPHAYVYAGPIAVQWDGDTYVWRPAALGGAA